MDDNYQLVGWIVQMRVRFPNTTRWSEWTIVEDAKLYATEISSIEALNKMYLNNNINNFMFRKRPVFIKKSLN